jgi:anti-sigma regulatory factor (Ser/Thr protein kinase)
MDARITIEPCLLAIPKVADFLSKFGCEHRINADDQARVLIVLEELLTNLLKYGYRNGDAARRVEIALGLEGTRFTIEFIDNGRGFNPFAATAVNLERPVEEREVGGFGLHLVRGLMEEASYRRVDERNVIQLTRRVSLIDHA